MARSPLHKSESAEMIDALLHLDEEDVVLLAHDDPNCDPLLVEHVAHCSVCAERVEAARALLQIEPFRRRADPSRVSRLMDRLTAVGAIEPEQERSALIRVAFRHGALHVLETDTEVRIARKVATRSVDPSGHAGGVTFFRQLGSLEVEVHLVRIPNGTFHLVVGLGGAADDGRFRAVLHRRHRELSTQHIDRGAATFKSLRPATYRLELRNNHASMGFIEVDVEANPAPEVPR